MNRPQIQSEKNNLNPQASHSPHQLDHSNGNRSAPAGGGTAPPRKTPQRKFSPFAGLFKNLLTLDEIQVPENVERTWIDRVLDAIVGENDGPQSKFALICASCFTHNGLVLPSEYASASMSFFSWPFLTISLNCKKEFKCLKCGFLNGKGSTLRPSASVDQLLFTDLGGEKEGTPEHPVLQEPTIPDIPSGEAGTMADSSSNAPRDS